MIVNTPFSFCLLGRKQSRKGRRNASHCKSRGTPEKREREARKKRLLGKNCISSKFLHVNNVENGRAPG